MPLLVLGLRGYGLIGTVTAQRDYRHHAIRFPWVGAWDGLRAGVQAPPGVGA